MSDIYKLQYNGMTLAYPGWNGYVGYDDVPKFKTLTLYASEGGTVTASVLTGMPGDTAQITTAYNTYYRFSGYDTAGGGSLNGDVYTFGDTDADISAVYKVNYFTASGAWEKGSNVGVRKFGGGSSAANIATKYATASFKTDNVPTSWYSASNRWNVPSTVSSYSIHLKPVMKFTTNTEANAQVGGAYFTARSLIGSTSTAQQTKSITTTAGTWNYTADITSTTTNVLYGISAKIQANGDKNYLRFRSAFYIATGTTGTWTATGIAP